jgi:hypothetical protein
MQVDIHMFEHQVYVLVVLRSYYVLQLYYIRVLQLLQEHYLTICPLRVGRVCECVEVLL